MRLKEILVFIILEILIIIPTYMITRRSVNNLEEKFFSDGLESDINYLNDLLGNGSWSKSDNNLYLDGKGDDKDENAYSNPFLELAQKTSTMSYIFVLTSDDNLVWTEDKKTGY